MNHHTSYTFSMSRRAALRLTADIVTPAVRLRTPVAPTVGALPARLPAVRTASTKATSKADSAADTNASSSAQPIASSSKAPLGKAPSPKGKDLAVPSLSRPPGVAHPPSTVKKTWSDKKAELLNAERHKAKRKALSVSFGICILFELSDLSQDEGSFSGVLSRLQSRAVRKWR